MKTLDELNTDLDVFEYVKNHLLKQKAQSINPYTTDCLYRYDPGAGHLDVMQCAVGCLIKEEFYSEEFESKSVQDPWVYDAVYNSVSNWIAVNTVMLAKLQAIHDTVSVEDWEKSLDEFDQYDDVFNEYGMFICND